MERGEVRVRSGGVRHRNSPAAYGVGLRCAVVLFTRDLRVHDNPALAAAVREAETVVPLFVREPALGAVSKRRTALLDAALADLDASLRQRGGALVVRRGDAIAETVKVARRTGAEVVFAASDVSAYAQRRERRLGEALEVRTLPGVTVVPPGELTPDGRDCYLVFTPYHRVWSGADRRRLERAPRLIRLPETLRTAAPFRTNGAGGETAARKQLERWLAHGDADYAERNDDLAADATSRLSIPLHLGLLSPLEVATRSRSEELVRQLCWRDFYAQLLAANPWSADRDLRHEGRRRWRHDPEGLAAWKAGMTGFPVVDAGMRELAQTGFMHNRARLAVASFLTKDLSIDWREGARHFLELLLDGDIASNAGNWQWAAGTGVDTRPGRIFNPTLQARRFDPTGEYVRRWVPELEAVPDESVHEPWKLGAHTEAAIQRRSSTTPRPRAATAPSGDYESQGEGRAVPGRQQPGAHTSPLGPNRPAARCSTDGSRRSSISSRIIATKAGCVPAVPARHTDTPASSPASTASWSRSYSTSMWSETKPTGETTTSRAPSPASRRISSQTSGSSQGTDGGPLRLWKTTEWEETPTAAATSAEVSPSCSA
jgi:deoxyribodipyrimidine photo-lyase